MANNFNIVSKKRFDTIDDNLAIVNTVVDNIRTIDFPVTDGLTLAVGSVADDIRAVDVPAISGIIEGLNDVSLIEIAGYMFVESDDLVHSNDTEEIGTGSSYEKVKEIYCSIVGTLRIKFDLKSSGSPVRGKGKIYKNGGAVGVERSVQSATYETFSEDLVFEKEDLLQLYCYQDASGSYIVRNLRIYGKFESGFKNNL